MKRKLLILFKTFSFLSVIPTLLLLELFIKDYSSTGFIIGWIIGSSIKLFYSNPLYINKLAIENSILKIEHANPFLKKGHKKYDLKMISNFKVRRETFFSKYGKVEFKFDGFNKKFVFLKTELKMIIKETNRIVE